MTDARRGDVVLVEFPFIAEHAVERKRRPALVVQSDRYNRRRASVIIAAVTSSRAHKKLPAKVAVAKNSRAGREGGLRLDSIVDCQTLATIPCGEIQSRLGRLPSDVMRQVDQALADALGIPDGTSDTRH